jgi:hypothetical protein
MLNYKRCNLEYILLLILKFYTDKEGIKVKGSSRGTGSFMLIVFLGAIGGSLIGEALGSNIKSLQVLKNIYTIGTSKPLVLDLKVLSLTFGINFNINIMSILGVVLAIIVYRKH